jgi:hypothetical protein
MLLYSFSITAVVKAIDFISYLHTILDLYTPHVSNQSRYYPLLVATILSTDKLSEDTFENPFPTCLDDVSVAWDDPVEVLIEDGFEFFVELSVC